MPRPVAGRQSFRMSKTDLRARPIFSHTRDASEAHLTIVFAALAISRHPRAETGMSIRRIVRTLLRPLQERGTEVIQRLRVLVSCSAPKQTL